jgi:hypothetical protein
MDIEGDLKLVSYPQKKKTRIRDLEFRHFDGDTSTGIEVILGVAELYGETNSSSEAVKFQDANGFPLSDSPKNVVLGSILNLEGLKSDQGKPIDFQTILPHPSVYSPMVSVKPGGIYFHCQSPGSGIGQRVEKDFTFKLPCLTLDLMKGR